MKKTIITILQLQLVTLTLPAAVPLRWTVETSRVQPAVFEAYQGETLTFEAALQSKGKPLEAPLNYSFFWQPNGMGSTYWEAPLPSAVELARRCFHQHPLRHLHALDGRLSAPTTSTARRFYAWGTFAQQMSDG